jgi:hypothetical protein
MGGSTSETLRTMHLLSPDRTHGEVTGIMHPDYALKPSSRIPFRVQPIEDGQYLISDHLHDQSETEQTEETPSIFETCHGIGRTVPLAILSYVQGLLEVHRDLTGMSQEQMSPDLLQQRDQLAAIFTRKAVATSQE